MHLQLDRVLETGNSANKLTVSGGFADLSFLRNILREDLLAYNQTRLTHTEITFPPARESGPGVAIGNVLRGSDKRHSPPRILQFNFGIAQHICVEPKERKQYSAEVLAQPSQKKRVEGARYIGPGIKYILRKVSLLHRRLVSQIGSSFLGCGISIVSQQDVHLSPQLQSYE
jgi:hypothetical protein